MWVEPETTYRIRGKYRYTYTHCCSGFLHLNQSSSEDEEDVSWPGVGGNKQEELIGPSDSSLGEALWEEKTPSFIDALNSE